MRCDAIHEAKSCEMDMTRGEVMVVASVSSVRQDKWRLSNDGNVALIAVAQQ